jgi:hypothetical protein
MIITEPEIEQIPSVGAGASRRRDARSVRVRAAVS